VPRGVGISGVPKAGSTIATGNARIARAAA
jgi:hypothetical protein